MRRKIYLFADLLFVLGLIAIVVGIAMAGNLPLAIGVAGVELILLGGFIAWAETRVGGDGG